MIKKGKFITIHPIQHLPEFNIITGDRIALHKNITEYGYFILEIEDFHYFMEKIRIKGKEILSNLSFECQISKDKLKDELEFEDIESAKCYIELNTERPDMFSFWEERKL